MPYHVCGAQQDGSTVCVPSNSEPRRRRGGGAAVAAAAVVADAAARRRRLYSPGGAEPGYIAPDPKDPDVFFAGGNNGSFLTRLESPHRAELREVNPYPRMFSGEPSSALVERWQWTFPIIFSPVDPERALHLVAARLEDDERRPELGRRSAGDLTRHDPKTLGPLRRPDHGDMNGPEVYATVFALGPGEDRRQRPLGRIGRRADARDARRRQDLDERHAEGHAGVRPRQP